MGPAGLGWAADTGPAWPGLLFAFLGPRDSVRFPGRGGGGLVRAGPGGAAGRLPRRSARRTVCSRDSEPRELRPRISPREVFTSGGLWLVSSLSATQGGRENSKPGRGEPEAGPPDPLQLSGVHTRDRAVGTQAPVSPLLPGTQSGSFQN